MSGKSSEEVKDEILREILRWQMQWLKLPFELEQRIRIALEILPPHRTAENLEPGRNEP